MIRGGSRRGSPPNSICSRRGPRWRRPGWTFPATPPWWPRTKMRLTLLVGAPVAPELLAPKLADILLADGEIAPGLSSEVLLRRPDVLQAEEQLKGLNANIGAARAAFFPRITLVGSLGYGSSDLADLFRSGALAWNLGSQLTVPIFDAGANQANLEVAKVEPGHRCRPVREEYPDRLPGGLRRPGPARHHRRAADGAAGAGRGRRRRLTPLPGPFRKRGGQLPDRARFAALSVQCPAGGGRHQADQAAEPGHPLQGSGWRLAVHGGKDGTDLDRSASMKDAAKF